ncbi:MAG: RDD family protein [Verrucomicrobia bacterium]|nr:RDD family protein [Verrucomicrobiota bacterium]
MMPSIRSLAVGVAVAFFFTLTLAVLAQEKRAASPVAAPPVPESSSGEAVVTVFSDALLEKDKKAEAVVALFGKATADGEVVDAVVSVFGDNRVTGPVGAAVVAVFGNSYVNSTVKKGVVVVFGDLELGPDARIDGDVMCIAGSIKRAATAVITGELRNIVSTPGAWLRAWWRECFLKARPLAIGPNLGWAWALAWSCLIFYVVAALLFRTSVEPCLTTLETRPGFSVLAALLATLLTPVLMVLLVLTGGGLIAAVFVGAGVLCATLFGKVVILAWLGRRITRVFGDGPIKHVALAVIFGGVMVLALYTVPVLGLLVFNLTGLIGLGAVVFTIVSGRKREKSATPPPASAPPLPPAAISAAALPRAGFWIRMGALLLDVVVVAMIAGLTSSVFPRFMHRDLGLVSWLLVLAIYGAAMWKTQGTTIGGIICGLKVVRLDGREIDWPTAAVRALSCFLSLMVGGLGFIWVIFDADRQSWHDKIAGTTVVRVPKGGALL